MAFMLAKLSHSKAIRTAFLCLLMRTQNTSLSDSRGFEACLSNAARHCDL